MRLSLSALSVAAMVFAVAVIMPSFASAQSIPPTPPVGEGVCVMYCSSGDSTGSGSGNGGGAIGAFFNWWKEWRERKSEERSKREAFNRLLKARELEYKETQRSNRQKVDELNRAGVAAFNRNDYDTAYQYFDQARAYEPDNPVLYSNAQSARAAKLNDLAMQRYNDGDYGGAAAYLENAIGIVPNDPIFKKNLDLVRDKIAKAAEADAARRRIQTLVKNSQAEVFGSNPTANDVHLEFVGEMSRVRLPSQRELQQRLRQLRLEVTSTQNALTRLSQSEALDASQRQEWEKSTEEASADAWNQATDMVADCVLETVGSQLQKQLNDADSGIKSAVDKLVTETDPSRKEQLHAAIRLLNDQRIKIKAAQDTMRDANDARDFAKVAGWANSRDNDLQKSLEGIYQLIDQTLKEPSIQQALKIGKGYSEVLTYAKSILDSAYDISSELVSIKRISELNKNSEDYLNAVRKLNDRMGFAVQQMHLVENQLSAASRNPQVRR